MDPHEWEQYEDRYRQRPETYEAYVDVWNRVARARSLFGGWSLFSRMASAEPLLRREQPERVREAETIMLEAGYEIGVPTSRGARRWWRSGSAPSADSPPPALSAEVDAARPVEASPAAPEPSQEPERPAVPQSPLVDELLRSATYTSRRDELARVRADDERVAAALHLLMARGGVATAAAIASTCGLSKGRVRGFLAVLARILNIEGYTVLSLDDKSDEVRINQEMLRSQFHLVAQQ
jgi:hypothetical protein